MAMIRVEQEQENRGSKKERCSYFKCRGVARTDPKGVLISDEHFTRITVRDKGKKTSNLGTSQGRSQSQGAGGGGCLSPLIPPGYASEVNA